MSAAEDAARDRVVALVPELPMLLDAPDGQIQSQPLGVSDDEPWIIWFIRRDAGLIIAIPLLDVDPGRLERAREIVNDYNAQMRWSVLSVAAWPPDEQVATLSIRLAGNPGDDGVYVTVERAIERLLDEAAGCRLLLEEAAQ